ncbi:MAG: hypothetical protein K1060chlam4_01551 [Candidatus Anoxychlamydiales bacterium]|nr:hypothetical protein [Candidatus Anoxychlamydiales bacterium]
MIFSPVVCFIAVNSATRVSNFLYPGITHLYQDFPNQVFREILPQASFLLGAIKLGHMAYKTNNNYHRILFATGACLAAAIEVTEFMKYRIFTKCFAENVVKCPSEWFGGECYHDLPNVIYNVCMLPWL